VKAVRYRLAVLTHGPGETLTRALTSFREHVTPEPEQTIVMRDGEFIEIDVPPDGLGDLVWTMTGSQRGFCGATRALWEVAVDAEPEVEFVFWLEHDFEFVRPVDLEELIIEMGYSATEDFPLAQMALMRDAVNEQEKAAGGLFESRRDQFEARPGTVDGSYRPGRGWSRHRAYFTTNPSIMTRAFMAENSWPDYVEQCEGRFGIDLVAKGYSFGAWGDGQPWVKHIGRREGGFGY
jgi:hypothetical protein